MKTAEHPDSGLRKARWTGADLSEMSWRLCRVHAISISDEEQPPLDFAEGDVEDETGPPTLRLLIDLDYVVRWVEPAPGRGYEFWVAPATLVFHSVLNLSGTLTQVSLPLELESLERTERSGFQRLHGWHLTGGRFDLRFSADDFTMFVRQAPRYGARVLTEPERGGVSFARQSFA